MIEDWKIESWARKLWLRASLSFALRSAWTGLALSVFLPALVFWFGTQFLSWHPSWTVFWKTNLGLCFGALLFVLFYAWPLPFQGFLRHLDSRLGWEDLLGTWHDRKRRKESRFDDVLRFRILAAIPQVETRSIIGPKWPRWPRYVLVLGLLFHVLLLMPWSGNGAMGLDRETHSSRTNESNATASETSPVQEIPQPSGTKRLGGPIPNPETEKKFSIVPKYVPTPESEGPRVKKDVFLLDSQVPRPSSWAVEQTTQTPFPPSQEIEKWVEHWIQRENLDEQERQFVRSYFEKLRK